MKISNFFIIFSVNIDFKNPAGFLGTEAEVTEAQYIVKIIKLLA